MGKQCPEYHSKGFSDSNSYKGDEKRYVTMEYITGKEFKSIIKLVLMQKKPG